MPVLKPHEYIPCPALSWYNIHVLHVLSWYYVHVLHPSPDILSMSCAPFVIIISISCAPVLILYPCPLSMHSVLILSMTCTRTPFSRIKYFSFSLFYLKGKGQCWMTRCCVGLKSWSCRILSSWQRQAAGLWSARSGIEMVYSSVYCIVPCRTVHTREKRDLERKCRENIET